MIAIPCKRLRHCSAYRSRATIAPTYGSGGVGGIYPVSIMYDELGAIHSTVLILAVVVAHARRLSFTRVLTFSASLDISLKLTVDPIKVAWATRATSHEIRAVSGIR